MYEYIKGDITYLCPTNVIIETAGIGYNINISLQTYSQLEGKTSIQLFLHQYQAQNDLPVFYGFTSKSERELFRLLIEVSGIGANTARIMLSSFSTTELATAIATANVAAIKSVKGIGIKTAERTILELKGKMANFAVIDQDSSSLTVTVATSAALEEAIDALVVLGFTKSAVEKVAKSIYKSNPTAASEEIIRQSLARL